MTVGVLDRVATPADIKRLDVNALRLLASDIRATILQTMAANGGHLATNLGTVELSLALHFTFDSPRDRIVWDVGNQCYTHKLITGRRESFGSVRQEGGLSGFTHRRESPHDQFTSGHAGTALSSALGLATARDVCGDDYDVVAVVGDGALTAGLSYEAMNNMGALGSQFLAVLNDNSFAISRNKGGLAGALDGAKTRILDGSFFEQLGISYFGPVDGHDLETLIEVLQQAREIQHPIVLHVLTQKGRGYKPAESNPERFHGVSPFDLTTGEFYAKSSAPTYSDIFGRELVRLARRDGRIVAITAAMSAGTGLAEFAEQFPDRFFDVGIAEQHAATFAAGMAAGGARPVVAIYSTFLQRSYDQVIHDVCLQDLPVVFVMDRAGIVGADGATHHGLFDVGFLRMVPQIVVMAPRDAHEFERMLQLALTLEHPCAIRIPRGAAPDHSASSRRDTSLAVGRAEVLCEGQDVAIIAVGSMVERALEVVEVLKGKGISTCLVNARFVKPLDKDLLVDVATRVKCVVTLEEHVAAGGFGSAVLEVLCDSHVETPVTILGLPDRFIEHGSAQNLLHQCGLSVERIVERIVKELGTPAPGSATCVPDLNADAVTRAIGRITAIRLPKDLQRFVAEYDTVGKRDPFLWKWCFEGVRLTGLSCVDASFREQNNVTKVLGVMLDVLIDDVADRGRNEALLSALLSVPFAADSVNQSSLSTAEQRYVKVTEIVWNEIEQRARTYPRYDEFLPLLKFDYQQLLNTMRYAHLLNKNPFLVNLAEHDLYQPHNMHMIVSGTLDLMCSPSFDRRDLGALREALCHAQYMGRIGNLITTWERELKDRDFTSGVFARALQTGAFDAEELNTKPLEDIRSSILAKGCESFFLERWSEHRNALVSSAERIRSVDIAALVRGLEELFVIHMGSRGLK